MTHGASQPHFAEIRRVFDGFGPKSAKTYSLLRWMRKPRSAQGVVVHGAVRDVEALSQTDIAVFALDAVPARSGSIGSGTFDDQR